MSPVDYNPDSCIVILIQTTINFLLLHTEKCLDVDSLACLFWCDVSARVRSHVDLMGVCVFFQLASTSEWASFSDSVARGRYQAVLGVW